MHFVQAVLFAFIHFSYLSFQTTKSNNDLHFKKIDSPHEYILNSFTYPSIAALTDALTTMDFQLFVFNVKLIIYINTKITSLSSTPQTKLATNESPPIRVHITQHVNLPIPPKKNPTTPITPPRPYTHNHLPPLPPQHSHPSTHTHARARAHHLYYNPRDLRSMLYVLPAHVCDPRV